MGLGLALAAIGAVKAGASAWSKYKARKERPKFADSEYGQELARFKKEGMYSPTARRNIVGDVARKAGSIGQTAKASYAGRLTAQGLEGSIAGQRGMNEIDIARQKQVAETARDIETKNEMSKVEAGLTYAQELYKDKQIDAAMKAQNRDELIASLGDLATAGVNAYFGDKNYKSKIDAFSNFDIKKISEMSARGELSEQDLKTMIFIQRLKELETGMDAGGEEYVPYGRSLLSKMNGAYDAS